jgi:hypothetical protein
VLKLTPAYPPLLVLQAIPAHAAVRVPSVGGESLDGPHLGPCAALGGQPLDRDGSGRDSPRASTCRPVLARLLQGALHGDDRTAGNTITTVQQAMSLFFQDDIRRRCVPR